MAKHEMMTVESAVKILRNFARTDAPETVADAIGSIIDHVSRLEQALQLIENSVKGALEDKPDNAIIGVR